MKPNDKFLLFALVFAGIFILLAGFYIYKINTKNIYAVIVPHHNIVANVRAKLFSDLAKKIPSPKTIILLSPNHYQLGQGVIQTSDYDWHLGEGKINSDKNVVDYLVKNKLANNEPSGFIYDHGIYNILPNIHNNFPNAKLVPIIFEDATIQQLDNLEKGLLESCPNCLMVASVDFSHYMPTDLPQTHDARSIKDLQTLNATDIFSDADVDSGPAMYLLITWAKDHNTDNFILKNHTDSGLNTKNLSEEATTHVFGWYEKNN